MKNKGKRERKKLLIYAGEVMLERITEGIGMTDFQDFGAMKNAAACLKELKDLLFICPDMDEREQDAKIQSLLRRAEGPAIGSIRVEMGEEASELAE